MQDFYLKTASETELWKALVDAGLAVANDNGYATQGCALDIIGEITKQTGEDTFEVLPGFHANLRVLVELTEEQIAVLPTIEVETPSRVWA